MSTNALLKGSTCFALATARRRIAGLRLAALLVCCAHTGSPVAQAADLLSTDASSASRGPRASVVIVRDPAATDAFKPRLERVRPMVDRAITNLTHKPTVPEAWRSLVSTQDVVGIKVFSAPGPNSGTRPAVVAAVIEGLLAAGLPPKKIIVWDRQIADLRLKIGRAHV